MKKLSNIISILFHPLLIPTIGAIFFALYTPLTIFPVIWQLRLVLTIFVYTLLVPGLALVLLRKLNVITDWEIHNKEERLLPYVIVLLSYAMCALSVWSFRYPIWVVSYVAGGALALFVNMIVTLKWKISAHTAGIGAFSGTIFALSALQQIYPVYLMLFAVVLPGIMGSARVYLKQHTVMQTLLGGIVGFCCSYFMITVFIK